MGISKKNMTKNAIKTLQEKTWPGNIREFRNLVERLIILGSKEISSQDVKQFS